MKVDILDTDYNEHVELLGTAHFTRRSIREAYQVVAEKTPRDLALELDRRRFRVLNVLDASEFVGASDALGNVEATIWLIDMDERMMRGRIRGLMTSQERRNLRFLPWISGRTLDEPALWERGLKDLVVERSKERLEKLRRYVPSMWRVLIDERNALMSARLAWIVTGKKEEGDLDSRILALVGAAHVEGMGELLGSPSSIASTLKRYRLEFTPPEAVTRIPVA